MMAKLYLWIYDSVTFTHNVRVPKLDRLFIMYYVFTFYGCFLLHGNYVSDIMIMWYYHCFREDAVWRKCFYAASSAPCGCVGNWGWWHAIRVLHLTERRRSFSGKTCQIYCIHLHLIYLYYTGKKKNVVIDQLALPLAQTVLIISILYQWFIQLPFCIIVY